MDPYFPWSRNRREGKYSIPFNDLPTGIHHIRFETEKKFLECEIKHWLSMYGYAWEITKIFSTGQNQQSLITQDCTH